MLIIPFTWVLLFYIFYNGENPLAFSYVHYNKRTFRKQEGLFSIFYSFTPPAEMLLIMYLEQKLNTINMGTTEMATAR